MKYLLTLMALLCLAAATFFALGFQTSAEGDFQPTFGKGEHTVWLEDEEAFGNTYEYYSAPSPDGWVTSVISYADYSTVIFVCNLVEAEDYAKGYYTLLSVRFYLNDSMPFSDEEVSAMVTIGEQDALERTFYRWPDDLAVIETFASTFDLTRMADAFTVGIGPFSFEHDIEGIFNVPVARNIVWCDDEG